MGRCLVFSSLLFVLSIWTEESTTNQIATGTDPLKYANQTQTTPNSIPLDQSAVEGLVNASDKVVDCIANLAVIKDRLRNSSTKLSKICLGEDREYKEAMDCADTGLENYCQQVSTCDHRVILSELKNTTQMLCQKACPDFLTVRETLSQCWENWADMGTAHEQNNFFDLCTQWRRSVVCHSQAVTNCSESFVLTILTMVVKSVEGGYEAMKEKTEQICGSPACPIDVLKTVSDCKLILRQAGQLEDEAAVHAAVPLANGTSVCQERTDKCVKTEDSAEKCPTLDYLLRRIDSEYNKTIAWLNKKCQTLTPASINTTTSITTTTPISTTRFINTTAAINSTAAINTTAATSAAKWSTEISNNTREYSNITNKFPREALIEKETRELVDESHAKEQVIYFAANGSTETPSTSAERITKYAGKKIIAGNDWVPCDDNVGESKNAAGSQAPVFTLVTMMTIGLLWKEWM